jgi:hypothetical protein
MHDEGLSLALSLLSLTRRGVVVKPWGSQDVWLLYNGSLFTYGTEEQGGQLPSDHTPWEEGSRGSETKTKKEPNTHVFFKQLVFAFFPGLVRFLLAPSTLLPFASSTTSIVVLAITTPPRR